MMNEEDTFAISKTLESCLDNIIFREDEKKYLSRINSNFNKIFKREDFNKQGVTKYLKEFFEKIQNADYPLGHKYIDLEKDYDSREEYSFKNVCDSFFNELINYKNAVKKENRIYEL